MIWIMNIMAHTSMSCARGLPLINIRMRIHQLIHGTDPESTIKDFVSFAIKELGLDRPPEIALISKHVKSNITNSFASYSPGEKKVRVFAPNRHIMDFLRSLAHELVHYKQDLEGRLGPKSGETGSPEENEAHAVAGVLMRKYGRLHPELFS